MVIGKCMIGKSPGLSKKLHLMCGGVCSVYPTVRRWLRCCLVHSPAQHSRACGSSGARYTCRCLVNAVFSLWAPADCPAVCFLQPLCMMWPAKDFLQTSAVVGLWMAAVWMSWCPLCAGHSYSCCHINMRHMQFQALRNHMVGQCVLCVACMMHHPTLACFYEHGHVQRGRCLLSCSSLNAHCCNTLNRTT
jgi:hypothetical protein